LHGGHWPKPATIPPGAEIQKACQAIRIADAA
jgi:hypothetical protein